MKNFKIAVLVGSLRKESFNRKVAESMITLAADNLQFEIIEIAKLPLYNQDLDESPPESWTQFRTQIKAADGLLFVTPEYNRSVPGVLKNAIDIASRPYGKNVFSGKPGAVVSVSIGAMGGFGANHHLRQMLVFLNVPTLAQPEVYLAEVAKLFDEKGVLVNESTREFFRKFMTAFGDWVKVFERK